MSYYWQVKNEKYGTHELAAETRLEAIQMAAKHWGCEKWTEIAYNTELVLLGKTIEEGKKNDKDEHDSPRGRGAGNTPELGSNAEREVPGADAPVSHSKRRTQKRSGSGEVQG